MFDPIAHATIAIANHGSLAPVLVFIAGVVSCLGPCAAPRLLAIVSCAGNEPSRLRVTIALFVGGLVSAYACFGAFSSLIGGILDLSNLIFGSVGLAMILSGVWGVVHATPAECAHVPSVPIEPSYGGIFLLGGSFAFVLAPCCAPLISAIVAYTSVQGDVLYGAGLLATFALGHSMPVALLGLGAGALAERLRRLALHQATAVASGALMVLLGAFYACLA